MCKDRTVFLRLFLDFKMKTFTSMNTESVFEFEHVVFMLFVFVCFWQFWLRSLKKLLKVSECVSVRALRAGAVSVKCFLRIACVHVRQSIWFN